MEISDLGLRLRTRNRLEANGVASMDQFMRLTRGQVTGWHQTGEVVWEDISAAQELLQGVVEVDHTGDEEEPQDARPATPVGAGTSGPTRTGPATVLELIDWAIDSAGYDKKMCREHLVKARRLIQEGKV